MEFWLLLFSLNNIISLFMWCCLFFIVITLIWPFTWTLKVRISQISKRTGLYKFGIFCPSLVALIQQPYIACTVLALNEFLFLKKGVCKTGMQINICQREHSSCHQQTTKGHGGLEEEEMASLKDD